MSIGSELGLDSIFCKTHNSKNSEDSMGDGEFETPKPLWVRQWFTVLS